MALSVDHLDMTIPSDASAADVMAVVMATDQTIALPAGWNLLRAGVTTGLNYSISTINVTAANRGNSYTWQFGAATEQWAELWLLVRGVNSIDGILFNDISSPTTAFSTPSITTTGNGDLVLIYYLVLNPANILLPPVPNGFTAQSSSYSRGSISVAFRGMAQQHSGPTGTWTATIDTPSVGSAIVAGLSGAAIISVQGGCAT